MKFKTDIPNVDQWIIDHQKDLEINWSKESISLHLNKENSFNFYLTENDKIIGMLVGHFLYQDQKNSEFEILHVAVMPDYRNQGIGKKILEELEKQLKMIDKSIKIFLEASSINKFAIKLYEKLGYKAYNERKNYYRGNSLNSFTSQDAILFAKSLDDIS